MKKQSHAPWKSNGTIVSIKAKDTRENESMWGTKRKSRKSWKVKRTVEKRGERRRRGRSCLKEEKLESSLPHTTCRHHGRPEAHGPQGPVCSPAAGAVVLCADWPAPWKVSLEGVLMNGLLLQPLLSPAESTLRTVGGTLKFEGRKLNELKIPRPPHGTWWPGFESYLPQLFTEWPLKNYCISYSLSFPTCKVAIGTPFSSGYNKD